MMNKLWKRQRKLSLITYSILILVNGMDRNLTVLTQWLYIEHLVHTNNGYLTFVSKKIGKNLM